MNIANVYKGHSHEDAVSALTSEFNANRSSTQQNCLGVKWTPTSMFVWVYLSIYLVSGFSDAFTIIKTKNIQDHYINR